MMNPGEMAANTTIQEYMEKLRLLKAHNPGVLNRLSRRIIQLLESHRDQIQAFFDEIVHEAESQLGSTAANLCSGDEDDEDEAAVICEAWIGDTITDGSVEDWILCTLDGHGVIYGTKMIEKMIDNLASGSPSVQI